MEKLTLKNFGDTRYEVIRTLDLDVLRSFLSSKGLQVLDIFRIKIFSDDDLVRVKFRCKVPENLIVYNRDFLGEYVTSSSWFVFKDGNLFFEGSFYYV